MTQPKAVTACSFKLSQISEWETGIALLDAPGGSVQMIFPVNGTSPSDILKEVYDFQLTPDAGSFTIQGD